jgi:4-hydroxy-3-polyprenylbenzoate decarboxylase
MAFKDNRQFIEALENTGDVVRIKREVDWELEAGAITRHVCETGAAAPFFEKIKDYPDGYRLFGAPLATYRRLSIAMGLEPDTPYRGIGDEFEKRLHSPIKPIVVKDGPCKQNVILGDEVDVFRFPAPLAHSSNGGRHIGTWHLMITKDANTQWVNWGMYRMMIHNEKLVGVALLRYIQQGGSVFYEGYVSQNQPMPFAVAIGADPLSSLIATTPLPAGWSEADYAGALAQEPIELVKCETNDLLVPAHAEIILEGEVLPDVRVPEGPFGEYDGYQGGPRAWVPAFHVKAITHRNDPILTMSNPGIPVDDSCLCGSVNIAWAIKRLLLSFGVPVTGVSVPPELSSTLVAVSIKRITPGQATQVFHLIAGWDVRPYYIVVVEVSKQDVPMVLVPFHTRDEIRKGEGVRVLFDCTWPSDWGRENIPTRVSFKEAYPEEVRDRVLQNWGSYGFK